MFCLFSVAVATQGHLFGFQVVCSAELCVSLEGETVLGAQPAGTGVAPALLFEPTELEDIGSLLEYRDGHCRGGFLFKSLLF